MLVHFEQNITGQVLVLSVRSMQRLRSTNSFYSIIIALHIELKHTRSKAIRMTDIVISARWNDRRVNYVREFNKHALFLFFLFYRNTLEVRKNWWVYSFQLFDNMKTVDITAMLNLQLLENTEFSINDESR